MLTEEARARLPWFRVHTDAQWLRVKDAMPGLQFIRSGEGGSQAMLVRSVPDFYEGVVIGQLPQVHLVPTGSRKNPVLQDAPNDRKPIEKREIMVDDTTIDAILHGWNRGMSAKGVVGVALVYGAHGNRL